MKMSGRRPILQRGQRLHLLASLDSSSSVGGPASHAGSSAAAIRFPALHVVVGSKVGSEMFSICPFFGRALTFLFVSMIFFMESDQCSAMF